MAFRNHKAAETAMLAPLAPRGESDRTVLEDDGVKPTSFAFASDGKHLIGLGETFTIIWDVATKKIVRKYHTPRRASQEFLHRVGDADLFATLRGTLRDQLVIWNPVTGEEQFNFRVPSTFRFVVSSDGKHLLTSDYVTDRELYSEGLRLWTLTPPTESNAGTERGAAKPDRSD